MWAFWTMRRAILPLIVAVLKFNGAERTHLGPFSVDVDRGRPSDENLSAYDAGYVALAESLNCSLVTAGARISSAPGVRCPILVVPR